MIRKAIAAATCLIALICASTFGQPRRMNRSIPVGTLVQIVKAEDTRHWNDTLRKLLSDRNAAVRARAALAAGRIGNDAAVEDLAKLLSDNDSHVAQTAAFALGEIESPKAVPHLLAVTNRNRPGELQARAVEALGKIAGALPKEQEAQSREIGAAIVEVLRSEHRGRAHPDEKVVLFGLTAVLRAKAVEGGPVFAEFLNYREPAIRADAANTLARLRLKDGNVQLRKLLTTDEDPIVRANAARVLGITEDKDAFDGLLGRALHDKDSRVRVSAIRGLGSLKDARATSPLLERGNSLLTAAGNHGNDSPAPEVNELLEIAVALGNIRQGSEDERVANWLGRVRPVTVMRAPEVEIAIARVHPSLYFSSFEGGPLMKRKAQETIMLDWRAASSIAQGLGELAKVSDSNRDNQRIRSEAADLLRAMLDFRNSDIIINTLVAVHSEYAIPDVLRAFAAFKTKDLPEVLRKHLNESDVIVRATAAELLGDLSGDQNAAALTAALAPALRDKDNDAALAILDALGKKKTDSANKAIATVLDARDHLIRRRAISILKANGVGDLSLHTGLVFTQYTNEDYRRAVSRIGTSVTAAIKTSRGAFTVSLMPEEAPLNVDNFIRLAQRDFFNGIVIHRVVPNFVIQDGDPRGDGNGSPGYQIRCEINQVPYERGMVGMALSGKDTGGSQWFVTHSRQPHLDGGYTVFGTVTSGMDVVDRIVRGDIVQSVRITTGKIKRTR